MGLLGRGDLDCDVVGDVVAEELLWGFFIWVGGHLIRGICLLSGGAAHFCIDFGVSYGIVNTRLGFGIE